ncbi:AAA-like domain-containing protein [Aeromonas piscicola]|uniref:AAA-like domain-containing protein n=1 Tax=Aeromonas piscicola TaxID=600645 RepID=A0ABT7QB81_9GAMM|nr:AAA-like domain-containing protein [Aeromonas piscicola]MDM5131202.1 AAA-like domain-containing protein [Aeromonas piscicola]
MTERVLSPATIIPAHLYVERSADRQLRAVVDDMGRPAYVLVARQMGKTNLLLNMKRNRPSDLVIYFDLSNRFETARKFFRNIIDTIIEINPELFESAVKSICMHRQGDELEASVEYDRHLRLLLKTCKKKIVLILDEIDSLIGCSYSDSILAQIRSMYFSRGNHDIYNNLTYVLSGVAEPGDLIKDKNISPFNIGEKIYLEDFTATEFNEFIVRAKLKVSSSITERIFWWTDGSPRISWDICSEVESEILAGKTATSSMVDEIVDRLYYQEYDRAPVDHIRTLVECDQSIRSAIMSIRYDRSDFADDRVKGRLYLAGIAKSDRSLGIKIKNRVIDGALSERWLQQLENLQPSALTLACEAYSEKDYIKAIKYYEEALESGKEEITEANCIDFALSYFYSGDYKNATVQFEKIEASTLDDKVIQLSRLQAGSAYLAQKNYHTGLKKLQDAATGPDQALIISAKLNMQVAYSKIKLAEFAPIAIELSKKLVSQIEDINEPDQNYLLTTALANSSLIYNLYGLTDDSISELNRAKLIAPLEFVPFLLIEGFKRTEDPIEKVNLLLEFVDIVTSNKFKLTSDTQSPLGLSKAALSIALSGLLSHAHANENKFDDFINEIKEKYYQSTSSLISVIIDLAESVEDDDDFSGIDLLLRGEERYLSSDVSEIDRIRLYRHLTASSDNSKASLWGIKFLRTLHAFCPPNMLGEQDTTVAMNFMVGRLNTKLSDLPECFELWSKFEQISNEKWPEWNLLYLYLRMQSSLYLKNISKSSQYAFEIIAAAEKLEQKGVTHEVFIPLLNSATSHLENIKNNEFKNLKRNDKVFVKYGDAEPVEKKFKVVENDLRSGLCTIITRTL